MGRNQIGIFIIFVVVIVTVVVCMLLSQAQSDPSMKSEPDTLSNYDNEQKTTRLNTPMDSPKESNLLEGMSEKADLELASLIYNSEYDVLENQDISTAMKRWEGFKYTAINKNTISQIANQLNIQTKTKVTGEQIEKCRSKVKEFLTMYSGKDGSHLLKLHGISDPLQEYDLNDPYYKEKMELAKQALLQFGISDEDMPDTYHERWIKFANYLYNAKGASITDLAIDESFLVINQITKSRYETQEWDPRSSIESNLCKLYTALSEPQGSSNSVLTGTSFLKQLQEPQDLTYVDLRLFFKAGKDLANHGVFRFVWDDKVNDWKPVNALWFYNGPREQFYFFW